jgi:hypothetical protein
MIRFSGLKRDAAIALAAGVPIAAALNIWFRAVAKPQTIDDYMWLARLHEPAARTAEWVMRVMHPVFGYPWSARIAVALAYAVLVGLCSAPALSLIVLGRAACSVIKGLRLRQVGR